MGYKINKVNPSALAATELCPRFRPDGRDNDAAAEGTMLHAVLEELVLQPQSQWDGWIASREISAEHKGLVEEAASQLRSILAGRDLPAVRDYRIRMRNGQPRKSLLKPGLYPECEIDRGGGKHGYIDLLIVLDDGLTYILDWKFVRVEGHDYTLQLAAYACEVNRLCPAHTQFVCRIVAPRLPDEAIEEHMWGPEDLDAFRSRIAAIEERADRSANDDSVMGCPSDACAYCHWSGQCKFQAGATLQVADKMDVMTLMLRGTPFEGETVSRETFTAPATVTQRGLRRAFVKFLKSVVEQWTDDDKEWAANNRGVDVPGWKIGWRAGRPSLDKTQMSDIRAALKARLGFKDEDVQSVSSVDMTLLKEFMVNNLNHSEKSASDEIQRTLDPYMKVGGAFTVWTQVKGKPKAVAGAIDV